MRTLYRKRSKEPRTEVRVTEKRQGRTSSGRRSKKAESSFVIGGEQFMKLKGIEF